MTATDIFSPEIRQEFIKTLTFAEKHLQETTGLSCMAIVKVYKPESDEPVYTETDKARDIINLVCKKLRFDYAEIVVKSRKRERVDCRRICIRLIKNNTGLKEKEIGGFFGGRDRTTVIHALETHEELFETDRKYFTKFSECEEVINAHTFKNVSEKITITLKDLQ